ncbi:hypothetical protein Y1Q_0015824 [Alligator mississippiensis]|uniref:Uncharacterized protein n=1 Tax=Alligator mississippiensis TaxID=8496 RepID=A0A151MH31_ALLMI|nr:hypothetical protein Y1Q_0015824 [Alligator mississippiensis]
MANQFGVVSTLDGTRSHDTVHRYITLAMQPSGSTSGIPKWKEEQTAVCVLYIEIIVLKKRKPGLDFGHVTKGTKKDPSFHQPRDDILLD